MTLKLYIGTASEITERLAGVPSNTTTTVAAVVSSQVCDLASVEDFAPGQSIVIGKEKAVIAAMNGGRITLEHPLKQAPAVGSMVRHYDADYTKYRDTTRPFTFIDDIKTGGNTGTMLGQDLILFDFDGQMPNIVEQNRITIFESVDSDFPLFAGIIVKTSRIVRTKDQRQPHHPYLYEWQIIAKGYQWEADSVGIEEQPFTNINAGEFLNYLRAKWTNLSVGEIDTTSSPRLDYIRLANYRRFSEIGSDLSELWPGSEFFIQNTHTGGAVVFRQQVETPAPIVLNTAYLEKIGNSESQYIKIEKDYEKVYNIVNLPYYREQLREPDFFVQDTVTDDAFLRTSVTLNGQPSSLEESVLLFDDFSGSDTAFTEYDVNNPSPPAGFNVSDGYLVEGTVNQVQGLTMLSTAGASPAIRLGDIGRMTDPAETEPFTGEERQTILAKELVVNALGEAVVLGVVDLTTIQTTTKSGSTSTRVYVNSTANFAVDDRIDVNGEKAYIQAVGADFFDLYDALTGAPGEGETVSLHRMAKSRIKFGVLFKADGSLKYIKDGQEQDFSPAQTYSAPATYSLRLFMQCFESTIAGGISSTGCTLADASHFSTGDVVEIFTSGSRSAPERRIITVTGSDIVYAPTNQIPMAGYRIRTLPKIVLQIKGGSEYGDIIGRDWTTIYTDPNTWQTSETENKDSHGVLVVSNKSLQATLSLFQMKNPIPITGNIGSRYLQIGSQDIDSADPDVDCIVRKVGNHFQLDFFPDTKGLWASGTTLELRYKERWRLHLEAKDTQSMINLAQARGYTVSASDSEQTLIRKGGRALDGLEILPTPLTDLEAVTQSGSILQAVSTPPSTLEILTNTHLDPLCRAGQVIKSQLPGVPDMQIQRVDIAEIPGIQGGDGRSIYRQRIIAGTVDRLSEILQIRALASGTRLVLDDGVIDDTYTRLQKTDLYETALTSDLYTLTECPHPTNVVFDGTSHIALKCLRIVSDGSGPNFDNADNSVWLAII